METSKQTRSGGCAPTPGSDSSGRISGLTENEETQVEILTNQIVHEAVWAYNMAIQGDGDESQKSYATMREWITELEQLCSQNESGEGRRSEDSAPADNR